MKDKNLIEPKIKSILYTRVSTDREEQKTSFEQQQKFKDNRFEIEKIFDDKSSGTNIKNRAGFIEMLKYLGIDITFIDDDYLFNIFKPTDIKTIIVSNTSRFSRNLIDAKRTIDILHKQGIKVFFNDINSFSDNEQIEILLNIYFTLDAQYSKELSRKVKHGMQRLAYNENHVFCTGTIKGYNLKGGKLSKNEESDKIANIFNDYVYNHTSIRALGIKYKWNQSTVGSILRNKKYAGYNSPEDKEMNPNIEPIINLELFNKAQEIRESRIQDKRVGFKCTTYGLSSKLICPECGSNLSYRKGRKKKYGMWSCYQNPSRSNNKIDCVKPSISENRINQYLKEIIKSNSWKEYIEFEINNKLQNIELTNCETLKNDIENINNKLDKLLDLYLSDEEKEAISKEDYLAKKEPLDNKLQILKEKLNHAEDINTYKKSLYQLKSKYMDKLDHIQQLINDENFEQVHKLIKNIYFAYNYDIKKPKDILEPYKLKKKLFVSKIIWNDFKILDGFKI